MRSIPKSINDYFKNDLKLMAWIGKDRTSRDIEWGIFFGTKAAPNGDTGFPGTVKETGSKIRWATQRPLWLIPFSNDAKEEALRVMAITDPTERIPRINCKGLNLFNAEDVTTWQQFKSVPDARNGVDIQEIEKTIVLPDDACLTGLSDKGEWQTLVIENSEWPIWIAKNNTATKDRLIKFDAPSCHIITREGTYLQHEVWIGVEKIPIQKPFISINEKQTAEDDGQEPPIFWVPPLGRVIQPLEPRSMSTIKASTWNEVNPFQAASDSATVRNIVNSFERNIDSPVFCWLLSESKELLITYTRYYFPRGSLGDWIGSVEIRRLFSNRTRANIISVLQICRSRIKEDVEAINPVETQSYIQLLVRIAYFTTSVDNQFVDLWNKVTEQVASGLETTKSSSPVAIVPQLSKELTQNTSLVSEWETSSNKSCSDDANQYTLIATLVKGQNPNLKIDEVTLPMLHHQNPFLADGTKKTIVLSKPTFESVADQFINDNGTLFQLYLAAYDLKLNKAVGGEKIVLRDGALAFTVSSGKPADSLPGLVLPPSKYGRFRLVLQLARLQQSFFLWQWFDDLDKVDKIVVSYSIEDFSIPILKVEPAGQDLLSKEKVLAPKSIGAVVQGAGDRSVSPLVIPLEVNEGEPQKPGYFLTFSESTNVGQDHRLDMKLQEFMTTVGPTVAPRLKVIVLDAFPQITTLIDGKLLQKSGIDDGAWILARKTPLSQEGGWELLDDEAATEGFRMVLPSQTIGEAYVKSSVPDSISKGEPEKNKSIEYRFGAPAILRLAPERLERRYVTAPWNLRKIWGQAGDEAPGIPLLEAQFELLYGLMAHLKPKEANIAELGSKLGEVPVPPVNSIAWTPSDDQQSEFARAWTRYLQLYNAWKSRLAVLEPSTGDDFSNSQFNEDISFNVRVEKDAEGKVIGAKLLPPVQLDAVTDKEIIDLHDSKDGLAGGFHYGFESSAIYKELWREFLKKKGSSSGEVKGVAFSSVGGWGQQVARFAGNKTIIKSTTVMGRVSRYSVERIGRIGVYWNKAKHVIEYERATVPSDQFADTQPPHLGRPLVRKVREFIEILEPERSYPDFPNDAPDAPGSVKSIKFKKKIIPVLSNWGRDVWGKRVLKDNPTAPATYESIGWEVPLWKPGADPKIYPKPQVTVSLLAAPDSGLEFIPQNIGDPENLYFYTDTRDTIEDENKVLIKIDDNVHAWPAVENVDYADLPEPQQFDISPAFGDSPELLEATMPDVISVYPGFERYTFRLDEVETAASIAGRYYPQSGMTGKLKTVSMMRSSFTAAENKISEWWNKAGREALGPLIRDPKGSLLAVSANGFTELNKRLLGNSIPTIDEFKIKVKSWVDDSKISTALAGVAEFKEPRVTFLPATLWGLGQGFEYPVKLLWRTSIEGGEGIIQNAMGFYDSQAKVICEELDRIAKSSTDFKKEVEAARQVFEDRVTVFRNKIEFGSETLFEFGEQVAAHLDNLDTQLSTAVDRSISKVVDVVNRVLDTDTVAVARQKVEDEVNVRFREFAGLLDEASNTAWGKKGKIKVLIDRLKERAGSWQSDITQELDRIQNSENEVRIFKDRVIQFINQKSNEFKSDLHLSNEQLKSGLREFLTEIQNTYQAITNSIINLWDDVWAKFKTDLDNIFDIWEQENRSIEFLKHDLQVTLRGHVSSKLTGRVVDLLSADPGPSVKTILIELNGIILSIKKAIIDSLINFFGQNFDEAGVEKWLNTFKEYKDLADAITSGDPKRILAASSRLASRVNGDFGKLTGEVAQRVKDIDRAANAAQGLMQTGKQTLNNFRSVWNEFTAPGMGLNRNTVAMIVKTDWNDVAQRLSITPCIARVKELGESLEGLGLRLPVSAITDQLLSAKREWKNVSQSLVDQFGFSNLLSDLGGMRFDKLFPGFKMPEFARDKIKVTQGFDKASLTAWVNAEADIKLAGRKQLMSIGPILVEIENARFEATMRIQLDIDGKMKKLNTGKLTGTWHITIGGTGIMIFRDTGVIFKDNKITFDLDPSRMEMPGLLKLLTDVTTKLSAGQGTDENGEKKEVFKLGLVKFGEIPIGMKATLDLPPVSIGGGVTAITNLSFGGHLQLLFMEKPGKFKFLLGLGFYLGKKDAPFNVTIFILGGGGYIDCTIIFVPKEGLTVHFVMSVNVSAALAISAGFMTGYVMILAGFEGEYHKTPSQGSAVYVTIFVRVIGYVEILSIASLFLGLYLEATYRSSSGGSELIGTGMVRAEIRVCRFIKIKVRKSYTKRFAGSGSNRSERAPATPMLAASNAPNPHDNRSEKIINALA